MNNEYTSAAEWEEVNLFQYMTMVKSGVVKFSGFKKYISTNSSLEKSRISDFIEVTYDSRPNNANMEFEENDIIFAKAKNNANVYLIDSDSSDNLYSTGFFGLRIKNKDKILPKFVFYWLRSDLFQKEKDKNCKGIIEESINCSALKNFVIPLPPIETQDEIVEILEKAEKLKQWREKSDKLSADYLNSVFLEMFGDPYSNPNIWEEKTLGEACYTIKDGLHAVRYRDEGIPFIFAKDIINGPDDFENNGYSKYIGLADYLKFINKCRPEKGDVLYTKGFKTGFAKYINNDSDFSICNHLAVLKFDENQINGLFLEHMLNSNYCYVQSQLFTRDSFKRNLAIAHMKRIKILIPPMDLQNQFAELVQEIEIQKSQQAESKKEIDDIFDNLMDSVFEAN
jgi:type I restriction enzyme S subunit